MPAGSSADITVVITCFNYGRFLREAVESALNQTGAAPHVIVVDDGSTDPQTHEALDALPGAVEVIRQDNAGVGRARNAGLARSTTPYALTLDADDRLAPGALQAMRTALDRDPNLGFAYGWMQFFEDWDWTWETPPYDPYKLLYRHQIGSTALMRRELFEATGGFDPEFGEFEDWELWVHALARGFRGERVPVVTCEYRKHGPSKHRSDRRAYRAMYKQLRAKHADLYARAGQLARETGASVVDRAIYPYFWGLRPLPARIEGALQNLAWRAKK